MFIWIANFFCPRQMIALCLPYVAVAVSMHMLNALQLRAVHTTRVYARICVVLTSSLLSIISYFTTYFYGPVSTIVSGVQ